MNALPLILANWKMHGLKQEAEARVAHIVSFLKKEKPEAIAVLCPPFTLLHAVERQVDGVTNCALGAQDCAAAEGGAFTGDVSAAMLADAGCRYVIVGHSERRYHHGETDETVSRKAAQAIKHGLAPVICVGETSEEKSRGRTLDVVRRQVLTSAPETPGEVTIVAYEPVWAIGTGKVPSLNDIEMVHGAIIATLAEKKKIDPERIFVLYGGSVKTANAKEILAIPDVGGLLVGGASLDAEEFCKIVASG